MDGAGKPAVAEAEAEAEVTEATAVTSKVFKLFTAPLWLGRGVRDGRG